MVHIRTWLLQFAFGLAVGALAAGTAFAQAAQPDNEESRFSFFRTSDGFLRLDSESGQVSLCTRHPAGWLCRALPEDRVVLEAEITRLQAENAALKREVLMHGLPLPGGVQSAPAAATGHEATGADDRSLTRIMTVIADAWHRFVARVVSAQRDLLQRS
jgi:hypothetical protein